MRLTLSRYVSLVILATALVLVVVLYLTSYTILLRSYEQLEVQDTRQNVGRAYDALVAEEAYLLGKALDWAQWDDAYNFVITRDPAFIKSNMTTSTLRDMKVNLMLYVNTTGQIVYGAQYNVDNDEMVTTTPGWAESLADEDRFLWQFSDSDSSHAGLLMTSDGPMLVVANPILTSEAQGPIRGALIMGRYLDDTLIAELARTSHLSITFQPLSGARLPDDFERAWAVGAGSVGVAGETGIVTADNPLIAVSALNDQQVAGYLVLQDLHNAPQLMLRVELPRDIMARGRDAVKYIILSLVGVSLAFMAVVLLLVRRLVLTPVKRLQAGVRRLGEGDLSYRVKVVGHDEVAQVAAAVNDMAQRLHERDEQLAAKTAALSDEVAQRRRAEEELRDLNSSLEARVAERTAELTAEIAERERAQAELRSYADQLERSNRELQEFTYIASHDLQEPLRKIQAFGSRLQDKFGDTLGAQGQDYLTRMQGAALRMQCLIEGLLSYSRVTTKVQPFQPVALATTVQEVLADLEIRIAQNGGTVEVGYLPTVNGDPLQMRQLLQNLIANALKFHRPDVPPVVRVGTAQVDDAWCQIEVSDNGIGFENKYAERIFQVFQRLNGRDAYEGAGIGLSICRKIVERHGGTIMVTSEPGQGTTFTVALPIAEAAPVIAPQAAVLQPVV
jgi:signal transduction histidine kinase